MNKRRHPDWLKVKIPSGGQYNKIKNLLKQYNLNTVCVHAKCPNIGECSSNGTATFLIMGNQCSRNCKYCHVDHQTPQALDKQEPDNIAQVVKALELKHVVITSVTRDDLPDNGSSHIALCLARVKQENPQTTTELLIPDLQGVEEDLKRILDEKPHILGHNLETVESLFQAVRPEGDYHRSLSLLRLSKKMAPQIKTKSGLMVGMGETVEEIDKAMGDLRNAGVDVLTIGQYLTPAKGYYPLDKYYTPEEFSYLKEKALALGFSHVESGPLVRSSYHAERALHE